MANARRGMFGAIVVVGTIVGCAVDEPISITPRDAGADASPLEDARVEDPLIGLTALAIAPLDARLTTRFPDRARADYVVTGTFEDGRQEDVTAHVSLRVADRGLGSFEGATFVANSGRGGVSRVEARHGSVTASTGIAVVYARSESIPPLGSPALPTNASTLFGGASDASRAPTLIYPADGVVIPPNLGRLEFHWLRGSESNAVFEIALTNELTDVRFYARCERPSDVRSDGCILELSLERFGAFAQTNRGGRPLEVRVRGTGETGGSIGESHAQSLQIARDPIEGTLYYWTTSDESIKRFDFGAENARAETMLGKAAAGDRCVGCHALSRDGSKLVASVGGQNLGGLVARDLEADEVYSARAIDNVLQFASFSPDGAELVGVFGESPKYDRSLILFRTSDIFDARCRGAGSGCPELSYTILDLGGREASHPDWSPDGRSIVFTDVGGHNSSVKFTAGAIAVVDRTGEQFGAPRTLVDRLTGRNRYSPHFAPDSSFVVFNESICAPGDFFAFSCNADSDPSARILAVRASGGAPIGLEAANRPGPLDPSSDVTNTFPRFAPFVFVLNEESGRERRLMWMTFGSTRHYGLRPPPPRSPNAFFSESASGMLLWMTAIDPDAIFEGVDPSRPAFVLPFQDVGTSNHIGVWAEKAVGTPVI